MNRPILHPSYDKTAPTVSDEIARYREAQERVRQPRCYSPSEVIELAGPRVMSLAEIRLAECDDGWRASHGFGFNSGDHWGSWSPIFAAYPAFPNRHDALVMEIRRLREHICKREGPEADKIRRWLDDLIPSQADLFA